MQIIPVLDLLEGVVVRGVGGRRETYRPIVSRLVDRSDALSVARAFRDQLGLSRLYVADLDAILHDRPNYNVYRSLADAGFEIQLDAGLRNVEAAKSILAAGAGQVVAGLETWPAPEDLSALCASGGAERVIFSLDMKNGLPLGDLVRWQSTDPLAIARRAVEAGIGQMIVLDLAQVGMGAGVSTSELCRQVLAEFPQLRLITGGGIRDAADLDRLAKLGIAGVLVASALHDGRITRTDVDRLNSVRD